MSVTQRLAQSEAPGGGAVRQAEIDRHHRALAQLVDRVMRVCCDPASRRGHCGACAGEVMSRCRDLLEAIAAELMALMLDHFHREDELMDALPRTLSTKAHCERHRRAHVELSTRYNLSIRALDGRNMVANERKLERFLCDWAGRHALEYDNMLADLLAVDHEC